MPIAASVGRTLQWIFTFPAGDQSQPVLVLT